jgi:mannose-6-phosphate isomerase-like protein (cupin superfamily)
MNVPPFARLPIAFDVAPLLEEIAALGTDPWTAHFNADYHDGGWEGVALRAVDGAPGRLDSDARHRGSMRDTALMARCPAIAAALGQLQCPLRAVRLLRLAAGSVIREHRDDDLRFEEGEARLHVALVTSPGVEFYIDDARVMMEAGECWYLNLSLPHRVQNLGHRERIHLVIDCGVNDWLTAQVAAAAPVERHAPAPSAQECFARFRELVLRDEEIQRVLRGIDEPGQFAIRTVELGAAHGFPFGEGEVRAAMTRGRQAWLAQWTL